LVKDDFFEQE